MSAKDNFGGQALVQFNHGKGYVLYWTAGSKDFDEFVRESGCGVDEYDLEAAGVDYAAPAADGLYVAEMRALDDGPGDEPGYREYLLGLTEMRPATAEEWERFRQGEWVFA